MAQQTDTPATGDRPTVEHGSLWEDPTTGRTYRVARTNGLEIILGAVDVRNDIRAVDARHFPGRYVPETER